MVRRNLDPTLHPFEQAREYTRAVNSAKLDRMFAKPFIGALSGHADGVYCMARRSTDLKSLISGSGDGGKCLVGGRGDERGLGYHCV